ncbi:MAG: hypothetical protein M1830_001105 [Pleopsidium flavum]|nr:MAG: hypothetical protein M1830_001105 [Pleopsidium flavum]
MLDCKSCIHRCIRTILADVLPLRPTPQHFPGRNVSLPFPGSTRRAYGTAAAIAKVPSKNHAQVPQKRPVNLYGEQKRNAVARGQQIPRTELEHELRYLKDPLKLADHVRGILRRDEDKKALEIVRAAGRDVLCTVSWNHLMDYEMSKGRVNAALKMYNEMKKRAQIPDAHTYTILLRGLAWHTHYPQALGKALSLYHSMFTPNSPIKPSIIHTNAVLKVCTRARDMDSMWGIAAKLPSRGMGAPDNLTFTTILNAVRHNVLLSLNKSETEEQMSRRREKAILEGRRMWDDIIGRWRSGDMWIDEEMVCAMGRLLLIGGRPRDWDDVLSLVEQTMTVPRLVPRLGTPAREGARVPQLAVGDNAVFEREDKEDGEPEAGAEFNRVDISNAVVHIKGGQTQPAGYARPGNNILSLVIEACIKMRAKQTAQDYWGLLTDPTGYDIIPDDDNYHIYMRLLRLSRASEGAVRLLKEEMASSKNFTFLKKTFRIAISTCVRDKNNPNVMYHANQILDLMQSKLDDPDIPTMTMYMSLAISTDDGGNIVKALKRLNPSTVNLKSLLFYGPLQPVDQDRRQDAEDTIGLVQMMVGSYDRLMNKGEVKREDYGEHAKERSKLAAFVTRYKIRNEPRTQRGMRKRIEWKREEESDADAED